MMSLGKYGSIKTQLYQGLNSFAQNFHGQIKRQADVVNKLVDEHFPWHKDEKDARQENYKQFVNTVVPIERRNDPLARVAGMLYANLQNALDLLVEKQTNEKKESVKQENRKSVEPSPRTGGITKISRPIGMNGKSGYAPPTTFSLDGM
jgi:preprotein translocase subunit SecA